MSWGVKHPNKKIFTVSKLKIVIEFFPREEVGDVRSMLLRLRRVLQEVKLLLLISYFHFWGLIALSLIYSNLLGSFWFASSHRSQCFHKYWLLGCVLTCVPERTSARFCVCLTWWVGTMCARCWSRCKLRKSIRLEGKGSSAAAGDAGG